jgi:glycosyltransferase involved in cell wall biosynthesis
MPKFSIVIPCLNEEKYIGVILQNLVEQTYKDFDVTVVDGKSEDKTLEVLNSYLNKLPLKVLTADVRSPSYQRNMGGRSSRGEYILFLDADVKVESDFLKEVDKKISQKDVDIFTCWNMPLSEKIADKIGYYIFNILYLETHKYFKPGAVGTFIGIRRETFEKLKGFAEDVVLAEDFELVRRAHKEGFKYMLIRKPHVWTSVRRYDRDGRLRVIFRTLFADVYMNVKGPIKDPKVVKWEMGGHD